MEIEQQVQESADIKFDDIVVAYGRCNHLSERIRDFSSVVCGLVHAAARLFFFHL